MTSNSEWIDHQADRFEAAWQCGSPPQIEEFVARAAEPLRLPLLRELIRIDVHYRAKGGGVPDMEEYHRRFPQLQVRNVVTDSNDSMADAKRECLSTSSSLIARLRDMDPAAWEEMAALYYPLVVGWCRRAGLPSEDAVDTAQEVFRAVAQGMRNFVRGPEGGTFRGWLAGITRHKLQDHWRRWAKEPRGEGGSDAQRRWAEVADDSGDDPAGGGDEPNGLAALVRRAMDAIRPEFEDHTWQAFWRTSVDSHRAADVAADLGMSSNAVYLAKSRVLRRLREHLGDLTD